MGKTNLEGFKRFGFKIGFAGVRNTSKSSEHSNGRVGSILGAGVSDVTKLETFSPGEDDVAGAVLTMAAELTLDCRVFHKSLAVTDTGELSVEVQADPISEAGWLELLTEL